MFHFNKNEIWTLQKPVSLMMCLHRRQQFLFNGDYYQEQIKLPEVYGLEIMGIEKGGESDNERMYANVCIRYIQNLVHSVLQQSNNRTSVVW